MLTRYERTVFRFARDESREELRSHWRAAAAGILAAACLGVVGGVLQGGSVGAALVGCVTGLLLALLTGAFLFYANWLTAPAKLHAQQEERINALNADLSSKVGIAAADEVPRLVHRTISRLFDAYRELEIVRNRTNDDVWATFAQRLEEYKAAYAQLPPTARRFHEKSEPVLTHLVGRKDFNHLLEYLSDALDILLHGECDLDLTISPPTPIVVTNRSSARNRFIILNLIVGNRQDTPVSLYPVWHLKLDPGRMGMRYQPDAEPLKEWEENRREHPGPANPPLAMPLQLQPGNAATGYWCFFIGDSLENDKQLLDGRRSVETIIEIHDLRSGRRTVSDTFSIGIELFRTLLSPLALDQPDSE